MTHRGPSNAGPDDSRRSDPSAADGLSGGNGWTRTKRLGLIAAAVLAVGGLLAVLWAVVASPTHRPSLPSGQEERILALFAPYTLDAEVMPGWLFDGLLIRDSAIVLTALESASGETATLTLTHADAVAGRAHTRSACFALIPQRQGLSDAGKQVLERLIRAVHRNDRNCLWRDAAVSFSEREARKGFVHFYTQRLIHLVFQDAVFWLLLIVLSMGLLAVSPLDGLRRISPLYLVAILALGAGLRLGLSVPTGMGPWPFDRSGIGGAIFYDSELFRWASAYFGWRVPLGEAVRWGSFAYAVVTPLALYVHARYLFRDERAAAAAALAVALLPNHIRFSQSEVMFIPSLLLASCALSLVHALLVERRWRTRIFAGLVFFPICYALVEARPLNGVFIVPMAAILFYLPIPEASRWRRVGVGTFTLALMGGGTVVSLFVKHAERTKDALTPDLLWRFADVLFDPNYNSLIQFRITPPLYLLAAVAGFVYLMKKNVRLAVMLGVTLLLFILFHTYVLPGRIEMQARYHLHLVQPFTLLMAGGFLWLCDLRPRGVALLLAALVMGSAFLKLDYVRDTDFNSMHEYDFVMSLRERIPAGARVVEYTGYGKGSRMKPLATQLESGRVSLNFDSFACGASADEPSPPRERIDELRRLLRDSRRPLYYYEGLLCHCDKRPSEALAAFCRRMQAEFMLEPLQVTTFANRFYDENRTRGFTDDMKTLTLTFYRVVGLKQVGERGTLSRDPASDLDSRRKNAENQGKGQGVLPPRGGSAFHP